MTDAINTMRRRPQDEIQTSKKSLHNITQTNKKVVTNPEIKRANPSIQLKPSKLLLNDAKKIALGNMIEDNKHATDNDLPMTSKTQKAKKGRKKEKHTTDEMRQIVRDRLSTLRARKKSRQISEQEEEEEEKRKKKRGQKRGAYSPSERMLKSFKRKPETKKQKPIELSSHARLKRKNDLDAKNKDIFSRLKTTRKRTGEPDSSDDEGFKPTSKSTKHSSSKLKPTGATMRAIRIAQTRAINRRRATTQAQKTQRLPQSKAKKRKAREAFSGHKERANRRKQQKVDGVRKSKKSSLVKSSTSDKKDGRRFPQGGETIVLS